MSRALSRSIEKAQTSDWKSNCRKTPAHYVASKGSITVNGISLTVAEVLPKSFAVWIIPYTKRHTNLDRATIGDLVNLEFDILAKYVERMVAPSVTKE